MWEGDISPRVNWSSGASLNRGFTFVIVGFLPSRDINDAESAGVISVSRTYYLAFWM